MNKMENQNNNKRVILLLIIIIIILSILCILFATNTLIFKSKNIDNNEPNQNITNANNNNSNNDKIDINLTIDTVSISKDAPNNKLHINGKINLSYNSNQYLGITLTGYCLGNNNEKYLIHGPGDGRALLSKDNINNNELTLSEKIPQNIEYTNGTIKEWKDIDWEIVKIKYCKIDKMTAISREGTNNTETTLNIEKYFN